jgi:hypothetical protein
MVTMLESELGIETLATSFFSDFMGSVKFVLLVYKENNKNKTAGNIL